MIHDAMSPGDANAALRRQVYFLLIALAAGLAAGRILSTERVYEPSLAYPRAGEAPPPSRWPETPPRPMPTYGSNDRSRWATIRALVDDGTYVIGQRSVAGDPNSDAGLVFQDGWRTVDKVLHPETGKYYSSKPPLLPTLLAGEYWLLQRLFGWTLDEHPWQVVRTILFTVNWLPMVICLVLLARLAERFGTSDWGRIYVVAAAGLATFLSTFLTTLNNHTVAAQATLLALYPFLGIYCDGRRDAGRFLLTGLFSAWAACNEMPAALFGVAIFLLCLVRAPRPTLLYFAPAAAVPCAAFLFTNYLAVGQIVPVQVQFGSEWYVYPGSHWASPRGIDAADEAKSVYAFHLLVGHHGLFSLTPMLLLSLAGMALALARGDLGLRLVAMLALVLGAVMFLFYVVKTNNYGGWTSGPRWFFWLLPLWLLSILPAADRMAASRGGRMLAALLLAISALSAAYPAWNPWRHPWLYNLLEYHGLIGYP